MNSTSWIGTELNGADFGDTRLNNRLLKIADNFMRMPSLSINDGHASWAEAKAAYRFFENEKTNASEIFSCHQSMTIQRMTRTEGPILAIQDTIEKGKGVPQFLKGYPKRGRGYLNSFTSIP